MRIVGAVLVLLLSALPSAANTDGTLWPPSGAMRPVARTAAQPSDPAAPADSASGRHMAAAARKQTTTPKRNDTLSLADRIAIQFDLAWTGDYNGLINGEANDKTTAAIKTFQQKRALKETGVLNAQERAQLAAVSKAKQAQVGWRMIDDAATGAQLGLPSKQVPVALAGKAGTRWTSAQGQVQIETFRIREPGTTLALVYERQKKEPPTRKLAVNLLRPDFFILAGLQGLKKFYVRAEIKDGEVRGLTILYDQANEPIMEPVAVVMSSTFVPFPGVAGAAHVGAQPRRKVEYGTGIVVSAAGHILTDRQVTDGCNVIVVSGYGDADRQGEDKDLALLRIHGAPDLAPAAFAVDLPKPPNVTLVGIADPQTQDGGGAVSTLVARLNGDLLEPSPQPGFSGGAVLDGQGRLVGMVLRKHLMGPAQPPATVVTAQAVGVFLAGQQLAPASGRASLGAAKAAVVRVICVRK